MSNDLTTNLLMNIKRIKQEIGHNADVKFHKFKLDQIDIQSLIVDVDIEAEGTFEADWLVLGNTFKNNLLRRVEKATQREILRIVNLALSKTQKVYRVDVAGLVIN
ncbi:Ger(x)C family spore germination C-terminal domain-containing protein [Thermoflavimicrobium daqui]|uniref:Spore germination GerAC-like C-terminal domain-containing protein n=1 Tax=Thermoflavimicrobium daqui TaxID=2137476 RepID=A0A364K993_9BACL|nr:Ger(x)C family spore germination C-terminal domain-containing protein [Thermoflavimicrobium daqui]RAL26863.1 hypothetical protein DL897_02100 [Thermoflavimicrobium daqui]